MRSFSEAVVREFIARHLGKDMTAWQIAGHFNWSEARLRLFMQGEGYFQVAHDIRKARLEDAEPVPPTIYRNPFVA